MFDNNVDISKKYGSTYIANEVKKDTPKPIKSVDKKINKNKRKRYFNSTKTYREYQELRKTDGFKRWWKRQYHYQDGLCYYCKVDLRTVDINVEHITPMSAGGSNKYKNLVLSCSDCNKEKGSNLLNSKLRKKLRSELQENISAKKKYRKELKEYTTEELEQVIYWRNNL